jgi:hypothetical protein
MGLAKAAWSELRRSGFPVIKVGKQNIVDGAAALAFFRALGDRQRQAGNGNGGQTA